MNLADFNIEFDQLFNNAFSGSSPGILMYEKSLFLTQAQEAIVLEYAKQYDTREDVREVLRNLTINESVNYDSTLNTTLLALKLNSNSKLFEVPDDIWYILTEHLDSDVEVKPITLDEYNIQIKNPFKKPNENLAWRLDVGDNISTNSKNIREIIYPSNVSKYKFRYLKKPEPIILENLTGGFTIEGETNAKNCKLSSSIHRTILQKAVRFALLAYKENNLQNNVQLK